MPMIDVGGAIALPYWPRHSTSTAFSISGTMQIDALDEKAGAVFTAPATGSIRKIHFRTGVVTTGGTVDVRVETVSATDGFPTGTLWGANTNVAHAIASTDDNVWLTTANLTADASVAQGDDVAIVIVAPSGSDIIIASLTGLGGSADFPYPVHRTTSYSAPNNSPILAVEYSDGTIYQIAEVFPAKDVNLSEYHVNTSGADEFGIKFKFPWKVRVKGWWNIIQEQSNAADYTAKLYDSDGSTVLTSSAVDVSKNRSTTVALFTKYFPSSHVLEKDTFYRLTMVPTTANWIRNWYIETNSSALMDAMPFGQNIHETKRLDNGGSWTDTVTRRPFMGVLVDQLGETAPQPIVIPRRKIA